LSSGLPIVVLVSGRGTNLEALLAAHARGDLPVECRAVISNRPGVAALDRAAAHGVAAEVVDHKAYDERAAFDAALAETIDRHAPALIVLAGFMRILTEGFVRAFRGQILNIHPSLLPKYTGLKTHQRALDAGDKVHGVSVHFVTEELDGGPIIAQAQIPVGPEDSAETLAQKVQTQEHVLYPIVVRWCCEGRVQLGAEQVLFDGQALPGPLVLPAN
jgi:phosphoribosylglycinamide formyltransferase-1